MAEDKNKQAPENSLEKILQEIETSFAPQKNRPRKKGFSLKSLTQNQIIGGLTLVLLLVGSAVGVFLGQQGQEIRQRASTVYPNCDAGSEPGCENAPAGSSCGSGGTCTNTDTNPICTCVGGSGPTPTPGLTCIEHGQACTSSDTCCDNDNGCVSGTCQQIYCNRSGPNTGQNSCTDKVAYAGCVTIDGQSGSCVPTEPNQATTECDCQPSNPGPTNTPAPNTPTYTPIPTNTSVPTTPGNPTNTPVPNNTTAPTNTPTAPTNTPLPTPTPGVCVIDFESVPGATVASGVEISTNYEQSNQVSFSIESLPGQICPYAYPAIGGYHQPWEAFKGPTTAANPNGYDEGLSGQGQHKWFINFVDNKDANIAARLTCKLVINYFTPLSQAGLDIADLDKNPVAGDPPIASAYDSNGNLVGTANGTNLGDGHLAHVVVSSAQANISKLEVRMDTANDAGFAFDNFIASCEPLPTNTPLPSATPTIGPTCNGITFTYAQGDTVYHPPYVGDNAYFTCAQVAGADHYEFRIQLPDLTIVNLQPVSTTSQVSQEYPLPMLGHYSAQCRICTGTDPSTCQAWEPL